MINMSERKKEGLETNQLNNGFVTDKGKLLEASGKVVAISIKKIETAA